MVLHVMMVSPCYYPVKGGTETVVRDLSIALNRKGVHTDVMTFNMDWKWKPMWQGRTETIDGITVFKIPALNWYPFTHSNRITLGINLVPSRFTHILKRYDIVHFHELDLSFPLFSSLIRKPKIIHCHGVDIQFLRRYHLSRMLLKHLAGLYISISRQMTEDLLTLGIHRKRVVYLPNGVDTSLFAPQGQKEDNLLLFVGRLTANKGLHVLVKSLGHLKKSVQLAIIGPASWDHKYYLEVLESIERVTQKGRHKIMYLGAMDQADTIQWYQKASLFVLPSFAEGFPVTVLEALSCETPVIASSVGGIPEVVKEYENGILTPPNDSVALANAIQYLLENKEVRTKFGREGRKHVIKYYSQEASVTKLCHIYEQFNC